MKYSIVIRTVGKAGEKYQCLLNSISQLKDRPSEVIVVLPEGYDLPPERLGWEKFIYSPKGMLRQRIYGIQSVETEYILFLDDDMEFEIDMIEKLADPIIRGEATVTFPILEDMLPQKGIRTIISAVSGSAAPMIFNKNKDYIRILKSGGWSYNKNLVRDNSYYSQSFTGACYMATTEASKKINLQDEVWVEIPGFAQWEDQVTAYKYHINGYKIKALNNIVIEHLDAGGGSKDKESNINYASALNKIIFWHRYIYSLEDKYINKVIAIIAILYNIFLTSMISLFTNIMTNDMEKFKALIKGYRQGISYLKTKEYKELSLAYIKNRDKR